ncbi:hypothetical protein F4802DRAFT_551222 [Xylaria palmicola]|nr:hypothetical protein F4802DRAFT_551222 [Xylaria palmicola]
MPGAANHTAHTPTSAKTKSTCTLEKKIMKRKMESPSAASSSAESPRSEERTAAIPADSADSATPTPSTKRRKLHRMLKRPEIGSLYDILHDHVGTSLFLRPIFWTDLHSRLLGCRFVQLPSPKTRPPLSFSTPDSSPSPHRTRKPSRTFRRIEKNIGALMSHSVPRSFRDTRDKDNAMVDLLSLLYPGRLSCPSLCTDLNMRFGHSLYRSAVYCQLLWYPLCSSSPVVSFDSATTRIASEPASHTASYSMAASAPSDGPVLAYISRFHINCLRRQGLYAVKAPPGVWNIPVVRMQALRGKRLLPKNEDEDAHFLGVMIAMAQQSVYANLNAGTGFTARDVEVRLLTEAVEDETLLVYRATIPAATLAMLHRPHVAPTRHPEIQVEHVRVPLWPVIGLKERLGKVLGSDIVGDIDDTHIETFDDEESKTSRELNRKRRRDALSEVWNMSFCEDPEPDSPKLFLGKKRRMEDDEVGVVA